MNVRIQAGKSKGHRAGQLTRTYHRVSTVDAESRRLADLVTESGEIFWQRCNKRNSTTIK